MNSAITEQARPHALVDVESDFSETGMFAPSHPPASPSLPPFPLSHSPLPLSPSPLPQAWKRQWTGRGRPVTHRPWEDRASPLPPGVWLHDPYCPGLLPPFPPRSKTFTPILLYPRPEHLALTRPASLYTHGYPWCHAHCWDMHVHGCSRDVEDNVRHLLMQGEHDWRGAVPPGLCDVMKVECLEHDCPCGGQPSLPARRSSAYRLGPTPGGASCSLRRGTPPLGGAERLCDSTCPWAQQAYPGGLHSPTVPVTPLSFSPHLPFSPGPPMGFSPSPPLLASPAAVPVNGSYPPTTQVNVTYPPTTQVNVTYPPTTQAYGSYPVTTSARPSAAPAQHRPYLPLFSRLSAPGGPLPSTEIRRALLSNHPVLTDCTLDSCSGVNTWHTACGDQTGPSTCCGGGDNLQSKNSSSAGRTKGTGTAAEGHPLLQTVKVSVPSVSSSHAPCPGPALTTTVTTAGAGLTTSSKTALAPGSAEAGLDGWQEWAGRYGSFLQLLHSQDSPPSTSDLLTCVNPTAPDLSVKQSLFGFNGASPSAFPQVLAAVAGQQGGLHTSQQGGLHTSQQGGLHTSQQGGLHTSQQGGLHTSQQGGLHTSQQGGLHTSQQGGLHTAPMERPMECDEEADNRRHKCPYCDVTCTNNGQLKGHLRVHTGERPYRCECGRAFARNEELTRHRRIHSGHRPHQCGTCGKRFGRKDHLNKHQKTHLVTSEKKVHLCQVTGCHQRYTRSDALARHQWGAHGIRAKTSRIRPSTLSSAAAALVAGAAGAAR